MKNKHKISKREGSCVGSAWQSKQKRSAKKFKNLKKFFLHREIPYNDLGEITITIPSKKVCVVVFNAWSWLLTLAPLDDLTLTLSFLFLFEPLKEGWYVPKSNLFSPNFKRDTFVPDYLVVGLSIVWCWVRLLIVQCTKIKSI